MKSKLGLYILDERGNPVLETNLMKWAEWYGTTERIVAQEWVEESRVSTVFLGWKKAMSTNSLPGCRS